MPSDPDPVAIRLPRTSYLVLVFLLFGALPVAFGGDNYAGLSGNPKDDSFGFGGFEVGVRVLVLIVPIVIAIFLFRTATFVSRDGLRVRAAFGSRELPWDTVRGLQVSGRAVYAVQSDGRVRLPCVRIAHLGPISRISEGRLPELPDATPKPAPARRRRR